MYRMSALLTHPNNLLHPIDLNHPFTANHANNANHPYTANILNNVAGVGDESSDIFYVLNYVFQVWEASNMDSPLITCFPLIT